MKHGINTDQTGVEVIDPQMSPWEESRRNMILKPPRFGLRSLMAAVALAAVICYGVRAYYRYPIIAEIARLAEAEEYFSKRAEQNYACYTDHFPNRRPCSYCRLQGGSMSFTPTFESTKADYQSFKSVAAHVARKRKALQRRLDGLW